MPGSFIAFLCDAAPQNIKIPTMQQPVPSGTRPGLEPCLTSFSKVIEAGTESREKALGLIALMYGALSLSRAVAGTRLSDEFLQAGKKLGEQVLAEEEAVA